MKEHLEDLKLILVCVYILAVAICFVARQYVVACIGIVPLAVYLNPAENGPEYFFDLDFLTTE